MGDPIKTQLGVVTRLTLVVTGILVASVLVVGSLALLGERRQLHRAQAAKAANLAQFMAQVTPPDILSMNFAGLNNDTKKVALTDEEAVYALILDGQEVPLAHFFKETAPSMTGEASNLVMTGKPLAAIEAMKHAGGILEVTAPISAGEKRIGTAVIGFSTDKTRRVLLSQMIFIGAITAATICLIIALLRVVSRGILQPVQTLIAAADRISAGELNVVLTGTDRSDELGALSRAIACMVGRQRELIASLERQLRFLETLLGTIPIAVFYKDTEGRYLGCNDEFIKTMGVTKEDIAGKTALELWPKELAETYYRQDQDLMRNRAIQIYEFTVKNHAGELRDVVYHKNVFLDERGQVAGIIGAFLDISERKRAEAALAEREREFHSLAENLPVNIARYDRDGRVLYFNPSLEETIGIKLEEAIGKTPREFSQDCRFDECVETLERVVATGGNEIIEITFPDGKGDLIHHRVNFVPERDEKGEVIGVLAIGSDITDIRRSTRELLMEQKMRLEMAQELSMAEERERHAIATELHDRIGQDLALARIRIGVLAKGAANDKAVTLLRGVRKSLDDAIRHVRILTHRITPPILESGSLEMALKSLCRQMKEDYGLQVMFQDDGGTKNLSRELRVVLYNSVRELLINVAKHSAADSARILAASDNGFLTINVEDYGVGCDPVCIDTCLNMEGSGFGLFNVRRRIVQVGGAFGIYSAPGNGCRISITIPLKEMRS